MLRKRLSTTAKKRSQTAVDTSVFEQYGDDALPFVVFNTTGWNRSGVVEVELDVARIYFRDGMSLDEMNQKMYGIDITGRTLVDRDGAAIAHTVVDLGLQFGYDLPDDKFRQPYMSRRVRLSFEAVQVPALGLAAYAWVREAKPAEEPLVSLAAGTQALENEWLRVDVENDGSFNLTDKRSGQIYRGLGVYENTGDIGNEYMYKQPNGEQTLTTKGLSASIRLTENTAFQATIEIVQEWAVPASADEQFEIEKREAVYFPDRKSQRTDAYSSADDPY